MGIFHFILSLARAYAAGIATINDKKTTENPTIMLFIIILPNGLYVKTS
jgi:hypothetical protein